MATGVVNKSIDIIDVFSKGARDLFGQFVPVQETGIHTGGLHFSTSYFGDFVETQDGKVTGTLRSLTWVGSTDTAQVDPEANIIVASLTGIDLDLSTLIPDTDNVYFGGILNEAVFSQNDKIYLDRPGIEFHAHTGDDTVYADQGGSTIHGGTGNDRLFGADGADVLDGGEGEDWLYGYLGPDTIFGGAGDDHIVAKSDFDFPSDAFANAPITVGFSGNLNQYILEANTVGYLGLTVSDRVSGRDGTDRVFGEAVLSFADSYLNLEDFGLAQGLETASMTKLIELYIANFDRAPDALGLHFWAARMVEGMSVDSIADAFYRSSEAGQHLWTLTPDAFVAEVYQNILGRLPDDEGQTFWTALLSSEEVPEHKFILELLAGVHADSPGGATEAFLMQQQADQVFLEAKTDIGVYYSLISGLNNAQDAETALSFIDGTGAGQASAKAFVDDTLTDALKADSGEVIVSLIGLIEDPFSLI